MAKHVFNLEYVYNSYFGEFVKETEYTVTYKARSGVRRRVNKHPLLRIVETDDPDGVLLTLKDTYSRMTADVIEAEDAYREARKARTDALIKVVEGS